MSYNAKNYTEQGGEKTVIGGTLEIKPGASVTGLPSYVLPAATAAALGGVKATVKGEGDTVELKIGSDGKLYAPAYPALSSATSDALGGVKATAKGEGDTVELKIGDDDKLYAPTYPTVPVAIYQNDSDAADVAELVSDFNALLAKLRDAGLMSAGAQLA